MRNRITHRAPKGFTLVEILIVVIILGILAAIVIPQFTSASEDARKNSTTSLLQTIRSQTELYKMQHNDDFPTDGGTSATADAPTWDWTRMTGKTDDAGAASTAADAYGPYIQQTPRNPLNGNTTVGAAPGAGVGFVLTADGKLFATGKDETQYFDEKTGTDIANAPN